MKKIIFAVLLFYSSHLIAQNPEWIYLSKVPGIQTIAEDGNFIWIGSCAGALKINRTTGTKVIFDKTNCPFPDSWISNIAIDHYGNKWFSTWNKGVLVKYDDTNWTIYDTSNSPLSGCSIESLTIDSNNVVWISTGCTNGGLIKFDGTNWTLYNTSNSGLTTNYIKSVFSEGGNIWLASVTELIKFDGTNWTLYNTSNSAISGKSIVHIDKDNNGNIWLLHTGGVEKFDGNTFTAYDNTNTNIPNINNTSMSIDANNIIWTGCVAYNYSTHVLGGLMSFDGSTWTKYDSSNSVISDEDVSPVYADHFNNIWYGCDNTGMVGRKNGSVWTSYDASNSELNDNYVSQIVSNPDGKVFIGTKEPFSSALGLVKYDWNNWVGLPNYDNTSLTMATDISGNLYIKKRTGIIKYDGANWTNIANTPALQAGYPVGLNLDALATDLSGGIWMDYVDRVDATYDQINHTWTYNPHEGLAHYNGTAWTTFNNLNSLLPDAFINQIVIDDSNIVWVSTENGLIKFDGTNWTIYNTSNSLIPMNNIGSFIFDPVGNIWFSNGRYGFYKFDKTNVVNYTHPYLDPYLSGGILSRDIDGSIWQFTLFDLIHFDGNNWTTYDADNSPIPNSSNVTSLTIDKFGNKWLGTQFGVFVYKHLGVITSTGSYTDRYISVSVYPNPFNDEFEIDFVKQLNKVDVTIYDLLSMPVYSTSLSKVRKIKIPRNNLKSGVYFYQIISDNCIISNGKIIAK